MLDAYHLNDPPPLQFAYYLRDLFTLNWGVSFSRRLPITQLISSAAGWTLPLHLRQPGALHPSSAPCWDSPPCGGAGADLPLVLGTTLAGSIPPFWIALLLLAVFGAQLGWLPTYGAYSMWQDYHGLARVLDDAATWPPGAGDGHHLGAAVLHHRPLPVLSTMCADYVRMARAAGVPQGRVTLFMCCATPHPGIHHGDDGCGVPLPQVRSVPRGGLLLPRPWHPDGKRCSRPGLSADPVLLPPLLPADHRRPLPGGSALQAGGPGNGGGPCVTNWWAASGPGCCAHCPHRCFRPRPRPFDPSAVSCNPCCCRAAGTSWAPTISVRTFSASCSHGARLPAGRGLSPPSPDAGPGGWDALGWFAGDLAGPAAHEAHLPSSSPPFIPAVITSWPLSPARARRAWRWHLGVLSWPETARVLRAQTIQIRARDYLQSIRAMGRGTDIPSPATTCGSCCPWCCIRPFSG